MAKNNENFSMDEIKRLAKSDAGKQLITMLEHSHGSTSDAVRNSIASGNMEQAKQALSAFLADPKTQSLLKKLEEEKNG